MRHPTDPAQTLQDIWKRAKAGLSLRRKAVRNTGLFDRARRDFGGWTEALVAAGIRDVDRKKRRRRETAPRQDPVAVTPELLTGRLPTRTLARLTGIDRRTLRERRRRVGFDGSREVRPPGAPPGADAVDVLLEQLPDATIRARTGLPLAVLRARRETGGAVRRTRARVGTDLLARKWTARAPTDAEVARRFGVGPSLVRAVRGQRAAGRPRGPSGPEAIELRVALARVRPKRLERMLARLDARSAVVLRRRLLAEDPMTLEALGRKLSLTRERVRQIELAAIVALTRALHGEPRRAATRRRAGSRGAEEKRRARGRRTARRSGAT